MTQKNENTEKKAGSITESWLRRRKDSIPRGPFHTVEAIAAEAKGAIVRDIEGNRFLDFAGGIGSLNAGHCPKKVVDAVKEQLDRMIHPSFHVMLYPAYIELAEKLNALVPGEHKKKTLLLNSGAEAVENAVKIARRYTGRRGIVSFERGFHGRTYMAMSLTSKPKPYKNGFGPFAGDTYRLPYPYYFREALQEEEADERLLNQIGEFFLTEVPPEDIAAFIIEPVQGEGGFVIPSARFIKGLEEICRNHGILLIADEIQTGFGRTGKMFAMEHFGAVPDIVTMSKSIAAGFPLSAVTGRAEIMDAPEVGEIGGTYGGSPLACTAALKVIEMIEEENLLDRAEWIGSQIEKTGLELQKDCPFLGEVRRLGAMAAFEITEGSSRKPDKEKTMTLLAEIKRRGVILMNAGLYGNVIRFLCPLVIADDELKEGLSIIKKVFLESRKS